MKKIINTTKDFTAVDNFNIKITKGLKDAVGTTLTVNKIAVGEDEDMDGKDTASAALITEQGVFGTISNTVVEQVYSLIEIVNEMGPVKVSVESRRANSGRDYLVLVLVG